LTRTGDTLLGVTPVPFWKVARSVAFWELFGTVLTVTVKMRSTVAAIVVKMKASGLHLRNVGVALKMMHFEPSCATTVVAAVLVSKPVPVKVRTSPPS